MDEDCRQGLLLHIAAETDPLTAFAALPCAEKPHKDVGCLTAILMILCLLWAAFVLM